VSAGAGFSLPANARARFESEAIPHMKQMFPAAVRMTRDRSDAEDLIQETFARAYLKFEQFTPGTNLRAWLYCIMLRTFYSACRRQRGRPAETLAGDLGDAIDSWAGLVPSGRSAEAEALDNLASSSALRALGELPDSFKTVVYLADIEGFRYGEIAEIMGTPLGTVMSRIHRGRRMLRARLQGQGRSAAVTRLPAAVPAPAAEAVPDVAVPDVAVPDVAAPLAA
jgi:RNA polymerase sigma-70 factor, ECF subfamily